MAFFFFLPSGRAGLAAAFITGSFFRAAPPELERLCFGSILYRMRINPAFLGSLCSSTGYFSFSFFERVSGAKRLYQQQSGTIGGEAALSGDPLLKEACLRCGEERLSDTPPHGKTGFLVLKAGLTTFFKLDLIPSLTASLHSQLRLGMTKSKEKIKAPEKLTECSFCRLKQTNSWRL